jgi:hypothetical protein
LRALCARHKQIEAVMNARFSLDLAHKLRTPPLMDQVAGGARLGEAILNTGRR